MKYKIGDLLYTDDNTGWYEVGLYTVVEIDSSDTYLPYSLKDPSGNEQWFSEECLDDNFIKLKKVTDEPVPAKTPSIQTQLMELLLDELELHTYQDFEIYYVKDGKKVSVSVDDADSNDILIDGKSVGTGIFNDGSIKMSSGLI